MHTSERPWFIESIRAETQLYNERAKKAGKYGQIPEQNPGQSMFQIFSANHWMEKEKDTPAPKMLFGEFWYDGELCILFADTNTGKSVLAVQIGNALACRQNIGPFQVETAPANVVYLDFELSGKQFQSRYVNEQQVPFKFGKGFYRAGFDAAVETPINFKTYDEYMAAAVETAVTRTSADVLIIDNITCLRNGTGNAAHALPLMRQLKALKARLKISILVLAHTPKRNAAKPITRNDLQGSKMLINFADSAFAIGESHHDKGLRYLKQVKQRSTGQVYGDDNICLCRLIKPGNNLCFEFLGNARERDHLHRYNEQNRHHLLTQVTLLIQQGHSQRDISRQLNISLGMVNKLAQMGDKE